MVILCAHDVEEMLWVLQAYMVIQQSSGLNYTIWLDYSSKV